MRFFAVPIFFAAVIVRGCAVDDPFPGFPCCAERMQWMAERHDFVGISSDDPCDWQRYLATNDTHPANDLDDFVCPSPDFTIEADGSDSNPVYDADGVARFRAYRAMHSGSVYAAYVNNSNAADAAGVLAYLHFEVVPDDQKDASSQYVRHYQIDAIGIFDVVMKPSPKTDLVARNGFGRYVAYDAGQCTPANCKITEDDGYTPGFQSGNEGLQAYIGAGWYSFPKEGQCNNTDDVPDGVMLGRYGVPCTYSIIWLGKFPIDALTNLHQETQYDTVEEYRQAGFVEYTRASKTPEGADGGSCNTTGGISFWKNPCDLQWCTVRTAALVTGVEEHLQSVLEPNIVPPDQTCFLPLPPTPPTSPTSSPSLSPTSSPTPPTTLSPSTSPTGSPTTMPTDSPTSSPSGSPTKSPTLTPTLTPTSTPTPPKNTTTPTVTPTAAAPTDNLTPTSTPTPPMNTTTPTATPTTAAPTDVSASSACLLKPFTYGLVAVSIWVVLP